MARRTTRISRRHNKPLSEEARRVAQHTVYTEFALEFIEGILNGQGERFKKPLDIAMSRVEAIKTVADLPAVPPPSSAARDAAYKRLLAATPLSEDVRQFCVDVVVGEFHTDGVQQLFGRPVDPETDEAPNYHDIVKQPMDLGSVRTRLTLSGGTNMTAQSQIDAVDPALREPYSCAGDVLRDIEQTFDNAMLYNPPGHFVYELARRVKQRMVCRFRSEFPGLPPAESREEAASPVVVRTPGPAAGAARAAPATEAQVEPAPATPPPMPVPVPAEPAMPPFDPNSPATLPTLTARLDYLLGMEGVDEEVRSLAGLAPGEQLFLETAPAETLSRLWKFAAVRLRNLGIDWNADQFSVSSVPTETAAPAAAVPAGASKDVFAGENVSSGINVALPE